MKRWKKIQVKYQIILKVLLLFPSFPESLSILTSSEIGQENEIDFIGGADLDGDEDFEFTDTGGHNQEDDEFDELVGALQDIVLDPEFEEQQREFLERNCMIFEDEEENKIEYMGIFKEYQAKLENFIENVQHFSSTKYLIFVFRD